MEYNFKANETKNIIQDTCNICMENAECLGGDIVLAREGYFRLNSNTTRIIRCNIDSACPSQLIHYKNKLKLTDDCFDTSSTRGQRFYQQICKIGYKGNLCDRCDIDYSKNGDGFCIKCSENFLHYLKLYLLR